MSRTLKQFLAGKPLPVKPEVEAKIDPIRIRINLVKLLMNSQTQTPDLIAYMEQYQLDPNTYLPDIRSNHIYLPIIYYCCSHPHLQDFFLYLLDCQVNVKAEMVSQDPNSPPIELLYYSQTTYIPTLISQGARLKPELLIPNCQKLLIKGNITKLMTLYKYGAISKDDLLKITQQPNLIFRVLDHLYERLGQLCQDLAGRDEPKLKQISEETLKNYLIVFKLFFKNGVSVNQIEDGETFLQKVINTYSLDLIKLAVNYQPNFDSVELKHYSNFDLTNRQIMKLFYNDANYHAISDFLKDIIEPQKINVKTILMKKKVVSTTK